MYNIALGRALTTATTSAVHNLGMLYFNFQTGKVYRYIEADAACTNDTLAVKEVVTWVDNGYEVTNDVSEGLGVTAPAGAAIGTIAEASFGWIQVGGQGDVYTDGSVAAGEALVPHTVDGEADTMAAGEEMNVFAVSNEADHGTTEECGCIFRGLV